MHCNCRRLCRSRPLLRRNHLPSHMPEATLSRPRPAHSREPRIACSDANIRVLHGMRTQVRERQRVALLHRHVRLSHPERRHRRQDLLRARRWVQALSRDLAQSCWLILVSCVLRLGPCEQASHRPCIVSTRSRSSTASEVSESRQIAPSVTAYSRCCAPTGCFAEIPHEGPMADLVWSDPDPDKEEFAISPRWVRSTPSRACSPRPADTSSPHHTEGPGTRLARKSSRSSSKSTT